MSATQRGAAQKKPFRGETFLQWGCYGKINSVKRRKEPQELRGNYRTNLRAFEIREKHTSRKFTCRGQGLNKRINKDAEKKNGRFHTGDLRFQKIDEEKGVTSGK